MRHIIVVMLMLTLSIGNCFSQQKTAYAKPVNSQEIYKRMANFTNPAEDLYDLSWDHSKSNPYTNITVPTQFEIDLKGFHMPTSHQKITSNYGYRKSFGRNHYGVDIKVYIGDTIRAAFSGKVRISKYNGGGYGYYIVIRHHNGLETLYAHMSKLLVKENETIKAGQPIGLGGNTGRSAGSHLHFETRICGIPIDPLKLFDFEHQDIKGNKYVFKHN